MATIYKVALAGASGMLGQPILHNLLLRGFVVTILTRDESKSQGSLSQYQRNPNFGIKQVDYSSLESLTAAITGCDAVVSALALGAQKEEEPLIQACIAAGVPRVVPSAFGGDMSLQWVRDQPFWKVKLEKEDYVTKMVEESNGALSYTMITNGTIFDYGMEKNLFINMRERKITLFDKGTKIMTATTKDIIGQAVAEALKRPAETKNKNLYIEGANFSQRSLLNLAQELTPGQEWTVVEADTLPLWEQAKEKWAQGVRGPAVQIGFLLRGLYTEGFGGAFEKPDNGLLGIKRMSDVEVKDFLSQYL